MFYFYDNVIFYKLLLVVMKFFHQVAPPYEVINNHSQEVTAMCDEYKKVAETENNRIRSFL